MITKDIYNKHGKSEGRNKGLNTPTSNNNSGGNTVAGNQGGGGQAPGPITGGAFNFQSIMDQFYNWKPDGDDDEGRAIKNTTQANMVSEAFSSQMAQMLANNQAAISKDMMTHQQLLERQSAGEARNEEFQYGMQSMGAQFEHQNNFANAQYDRDIGILGATGEQERKNITAQGNQNRLQEIVRGEQSRLNIGAQGSQDRMNISRRLRKANVSVKTSQRKVAG